MLLAHAAVFQSTTTSIMSQANENTKPDTHASVYQRKHQSLEIRSSKSTVNNNLVRQHDYGETVNAVRTTYCSRNPGLLGCNKLVGLAVHKSSVLRQKCQGVRRLSDCPQNSDLNIHSTHYQWLIVGQAFDGTGHA